MTMGVNIYIQVEGEGDGTGLGTVVETHMEPDMLALYREALSWATQLVVHLEGCEACGNGHFCSGGGFVAKTAFERAMMAIKKAEEKEITGENPNYSVGE